MVNTEEQNGYGYFLNSDLLSCNDLNKEKVQE